MTNWIPFLVGAWLAGVILLTLRLLLQWVYAERLKHKFTKPVSKDLQNLLLGLTMRLNISRPVQLLESVKVEVPTVIGFLKPVILLPASSLMGLSSSQLEAILAHELADIRRHDYLINLLQSMVETLFFYNPAVWWVSNRIRLEREHCCDDIAVAACGGDVLGYAKTLERLEYLRHHPRLSMAATGNSLLKRIQRLVKSETKTHLSASWVTSLLMMFALTLGIIFWANPQQSQAQDSENIMQVFDRNGVELTEDIAPHAFQMIRDEIVERFGLEVQGLKIYSTIDLQAQQAANAASLNAEMPPGAQMALVGIDPSTGEILAIVGEHIIEGQTPDGLNRTVQMYRQPGSSFKPITYATAFEAGFSQATVLVDELTTWKVLGQADYTPENHDKKYHGPVTARKALDISLNIPAIKAIEVVTPQAVVSKSTELGYENIQPTLSAAIGAYEVTPLQHAAAFGAFGNSGIYSTPHIIKRVESNDGKMILEFPIEQKPVWTPQTAYMTLDMMRGNVIDSNAFSLRADIDGRYVAGKTGTSNDEKDIWFVGLTPGMVATVWIGFDDGSSIPKKIAPELTRAGDGVMGSSGNPFISGENL